MKQQDFVPLQEVVETITVGFVGSMASEYQEEGIPFLRSLNVKPFQFSETDLKFITPEFHDRIRKSSLAPGDVVAVRTGNPGASCVIPDSLTEANCSDLVVIRCNEDSDPHFVSYYINSITQSISSQSVGAIQKHFNIGSAKEIKFPKLSHEDQFKSSTVLRLLDQKIELNNRINAELESLAKLLYDYWFVQFDFPMTAEQAAAHGDPTLTGKPYKSSGGKMTHNKTLNREIPEGWVNTKLSKIAEIVMGQSPPGSTYNSEGKGTLFFQGSTDFGDRFPTARQFTTQPTRLARTGDILLSVRAPVGTINIAPFDCAIGRGLAAIRSNSKHSTYLFQVMRYFQIIFERRNAAGTTFGSINKDDLHSLQFSHPTDNSLSQKFHEKMKPLEQQVFNNHKQNQELAALRDWLLPMLMNGQVTVNS